MSLIIDQVFQRAEKVVNDVLKTDPDLQKDVAAMAGKVMAVELIGPNKTIYILPQTDGVQLQQEYNGDVHVLVKGSPFSLLKMARTKNDQPTSFDGDVEISGDLALGQHLQQMVARLDLDWEELLSHKVGDVAAHQIGNAIRSFTGWAKESHSSMEQNISEYLRIEAELTPQRAEIDGFMDDVDELRNDVDRLEQRIARLQTSQTTS
ncbi:MAG: SCP2 domain-containing protein [Gammaproteobacteria bacterium]